VAARGFPFVNVQWKVLSAGFLDGCTACLLMFKEDIRVPGSPSAELMRSTSPEMLAEYHTVSPDLPDLLLEMRDSALARDRAYARMVRCAGCLQTVGILAIIWFLIVQKRV
jgi:hypothetical protein